MSEIEELICDSDSEEQFVSQDSDVGAADQMILTTVVWQITCGMIVEAKTGLK